MTLTDDELDAQARALPAYRPGATQLEHARTGLLAAADAITPLPARVVTPRVMLIGVGVAVAAAAAIVLWVGRGGDDETFHGARATIAAAPGTRYSATSLQPDEVVRLVDGEVTVEVTPLKAGERFRVVTGDGEVEVRGTRFVVAAEADVLTAVQVVYGVVEVRPAGRPSVTLHAGEYWPRSQLAAADPGREPAPAVAPDPASVGDPESARAAAPAAAPAVDPTAVAGPVPAPAAVAAAAPAAAPAAAAGPGAGADPERSHRHGDSHRASPAPSSPAPSPSAPPAPPASSPAPSPTASTASTPTAPGEADFRAGWDAMKRGDHDAAAASFAASRAAAGSTVVEDATFWEGVALARAGESSSAITALERFVSKYPKSARVGEASARLGWLLLDAGDTDGAAAMFRAAEHDRVASVRASARKGLAKLGH